MIWFYYWFDLICIFLGTCCVATLYLPPRSLFLLQHSIPGHGNITICSIHALSRLSFYIFQSFPLFGPLAESIESTFQTVDHSLEILFFYLIHKLRVSLLYTTLYVHHWWIQIQIALNNVLVYWTWNTSQLSRSWSVLHLHYTHLSLLCASRTLTDLFKKKM